ncbi:hypothetical protein Tco_0642326 [Tanacetum coccineum]
MTSRLQTRILSRPCLGVLHRLKKEDVDKKLLEMIDISFALTIDVHIDIKPHPENAKSQTNTAMAAKLIQEKLSRQDIGIR